MNTTQQGASPAWYAVILGLAGAVLMVADQMVRPLLPWWVWPPVAVAAGSLTFVITIMQMNSRADGPAWLRIFLYRELVWVGLGVMAALVDFNGWTWTLGLWWVGGTIALAAFGTVCPLPPLVEREELQFTGRDRRPEYVQAWEGHIRAVTGWKTTGVVNWERWENPAEGFRLRVELPVDTGQTEVDLAGFCTKLGGAARLLAGCHVQVLPSDVQGVAVLDVMEVDNLSKTDNLVHVEPTTPASLNDSFTVMTSPRGEPLDVCLRIETATIGGATGSGKTTLMNRIIMFLARCPDTLIWVVDYNGGGLANNWVEPWARGKCGPNGRPVVDWVATNENEFALMVQVACAISTARKQNPEVRRRIRAARSGGVLPIGPDLPAIVVFADEGGSIQQKLSPIGVIAAGGLDQLAQLGRAMAVRPMVSVLRGTSDLMSKGFRTQSSIRLCLRMNEHGEYVHVLDVNPPKTPLKHKGAGYLRTMELDQPVYGRTVNVDEDAVERHAVACSQFRPLLDQHAQGVAARVRPADVTGGDKDYPGWVGSIQYLHAMDGKAYSGRWDRAALLLAELRDEELPEQPVSTPVVGAARPSTSTPALDAWASAVAPPPAATTPVDDGARIYQFPGAQPPVRPATDGGSTTARGQIIEALRQASTQGLSATELEKAIGATKTRMYQVLPELKDQKVVVQADGRYILAEHAVSTG